MDMIRLNTIITGSKDKQTIRDNQKLKPSDKRTILQILDHHKKHHLNNSQLAAHFRLRRNTVANCKHSASLFQPPQSLPDPFQNIRIDDAVPFPFAEKPRGMAGSFHVNKFVGNILCRQCRIQCQSLFLTDQEILVSLKEQGRDTGNIGDRACLPEFFR